MLDRSTIHRLIPILKADARRALRMSLPGHPKVYYYSFLLRDIEWFNTWAAHGSTFRRRTDRTRNVYADMRVGSYRYDQTSNGGLADNESDRESIQHMTVPIDDRNYGGLRLALWRLTEAKFREALKDYAAKEAARISSPEYGPEPASFMKLKRQTKIRYATRQKINEERWVEVVRNLSGWVSELPQLSTSWVEFEASQDTKLFVNTEGSVIAQHNRLYSLTCTLRKITPEGSTLEQDVVLNVADLRELPSVARIKKMITVKHQQLLQLARAKTIHAFSGPVLLYPRPAALLFHETLGHRLEGSRLLSSEEGQTLKGLEGKRLANLSLEISDNPRLKKFNGEHCIGAYEYDDEGTPAQEVSLVSDGILKGYLNTRAPTHRRRFVPNGHARNKKFQRPISRMGVFIVNGKRRASIRILRQRLLDEIRRQKKPFGLIVYETSGGETDTTSYDFQAFSGEISYATLLYPNGKEKVVRGVNIVGTPLQALDNLLAIGDAPELDNSFCGAESGLIPVSMIAPAVLLSNLELQAKSEELASQSILPRPK